MIVVDKVSKNFRQFCAVQDLSFDVQPGEVLGLVGSNGAGKTTLLRCLAGILKPDTGRISVGEWNLGDDPVEAKRRLAYLPDYPQFFETLTCWEHARFIASLYQLEGFEDRADALFQTFSMTAKKTVLPAELSHGMRQSLGLILAFMRQPRVMLFDEPMTALDPNGINAFNRLIAEHARNGAAILLSSHLLSILEKVSTKVLILSRGQRRLYTTMEELKQRLPQNLALEEAFFEISGRK